MTVQTIERSAVTRLKRLFPTNQDDQPGRLSLRAELFLIAHDDDTGRLHIDERSLTVGLAGAVLLELWLARRIRIGWRPDARNGTWQRNSGHITVLDATLTGDPIADTALAMLWNLGGTPRISDFVHQFATGHLYERVRGQMIAAGTLRHTTRRRFLVFRTKAHVPSHTSYPVRARTRVRSLPGRVTVQPDPHDIALAGLVTALNLTPYLYPPEMSSAQLHQRLTEILGSEHSVREVATSVGPGRGAGHRHR